VRAWVCAPQTSARQHELGSNGELATQPQLPATTAGELSLARTCAPRTVLEWATKWGPLVRTGAGRSRVTCSTHALAWL